MALFPMRVLRHAFLRLPALPKNQQLIEKEAVFVTDLRPLGSEAEQEALLREEIRQRAAKLCLYGDKLRLKNLKY